MKASAQSPAVLRKANGAGKVGTATGEDVQTTLNKRAQTVADIALLRLVTPLVSGQMFNVRGMVDAGVGSAVWFYDSTDTTSLDDGQFVVRNGAYRFKRVDARQRFGSFSLVIDITDTVVRDTILPIVTSAGYRAALAVPLTSLQGDYNRMTLGELAEYCRSSGGEVLSHGTNGFALNGAIETSVGESWIRSSKLEHVQYGFKAHGYVAISSTLDSRFLLELKRWYDYAFINSSTGIFPILSANDESSNPHDLWRVSLESSTLANLQACADYAKNSFTNVVFYTHASTTNLASILAYCASIGLKCEVPSEWFSRTHGLTKHIEPKSTKNLVNNSALLRQKTTDIAPIGWTVSSSTMTGITATYSYGEFGGSMILSATAPGVDNRLLFAQSYQCGPILSYSPFCFSVKCLSQNATNTIARLTLCAKDASNNVLAQTVRDFTLRGDNQLLHVEQGFVPGGTAVSFIQYIIELRSIAAGQVEALIEQPVLVRCGVPMPYEKTNLKVPSFFKMRKNTQGSTLAASTDNLIVFDNVLAGTNDFYDTSTGTWLSNDGGKYIATIAVGLKSVVAGDRLTLKLFVNGTQREQVDFYCLTGQMISHCTFALPADGAAYQFYLWHNSGAARLTTTGHDATLSMVRVSD